jgi:hypothetical protein
MSNVTWTVNLEGERNDVEVGFTEGRRERMRVS